MKFFGILSVLGALTFASPAVAQTTLVDRNFGHMQFTWSSNGGTIVRWRAVIVGGNIAICGATAYRGGNIYNQLTRKALRDMSIKRNGSTFMRDISFFASRGSRAHAARLEGERATCRVTQTPGTPADLASFSIVSEGRRYRLD
ncbi:hypothetical protein MWU61_10135 [Loktanella sp. F6476L]|uniref:hypothetical protein n=1 Tax=Loktanella sp. F6476L TaxID=2926405 RepID=UPI001FF48F35|nr:hypothetical protein [Loktanella sp. F6476L]MCK0120901.1 hypothetical protein [Loktanella sp. F6476L]